MKTPAYDTRRKTNPPNSALLCMRLVALTRFEMVVVCMRSCEYCQMQLFDVDSTKVSLCRLTVKDPRPQDEPFSKLTSAEVDELGVSCSPSTEANSLP